MPPEGYQSALSLEFELVFEKWSESCLHDVIIDYSRLLKKHSAVPPIDRYEIL